jgi:hypothetical protein
MFRLSFANQASMPRFLTTQSIRIEILLHVKKKPVQTKNTTSSLSTASAPKSQANPDIENPFLQIYPKSA